MLRRNFLAFIPAGLLSFLPFAKAESKPEILAKKSKFIKFKRGEMTYCVRDGIVVWQKCSVEKTYFNKEGQIHCDDDLPAIYSSACGGVQRWYYNGIGYKSYYQNFLGQPLYVNAYPVTRHITEEEFNNLHHS